MASRLALKRPTEALPRKGHFRSGHVLEKLMSDRIQAERLAELRTKMLEHLEAALTCAAETKNDIAGHHIERAMDEVRSAQWPALAIVPFNPKPKR